SRQFRCTHLFKFIPDEFLDCVSALPYYEFFVKIIALKLARNGKNYHFVCTTLNMGGNNFHLTRGGRL
ncbi:MAG: hypothetical protein QNL05_02485, partial [Gammaproteobacteria bacterium]|nr:hypothetical protein [Gammaproteobacteria bacterium]